MIPNHTLYEGRPFLRWERHPYYNDGTVLNKIHLNLGVTRLVSRVRQGDYDLNKLHRIERLTGLRMRRYHYSFAQNDYVPTAAEADFSDYALYNKAGAYVGGLDTGWWMVQEGLVADDVQPQVAFSPKKQGWVGFSHRGSVLFVVGDKLFNPDWLPEYPSGYLHYWGGAWKKLPESVRLQLSEDSGAMQAWAVEFIPFRLRGHHYINDLDEARLAAIKAAEYLS